MTRKAYQKAMDTSQVKDISVNSAACIVKLRDKIFPFKGSRGKKLLSKYIKVQVIINKQWKRYKVFITTLFFSSIPHLSCVCWVAELSKSFSNRA